MNKDTVIKSLKIAVAVVLTIAIAGELGLRCYYKNCQKPDTGFSVCSPFLES